MFGEAYEKELLKIPVSDNTISRRIKDMSEDIELQVISHIREVDMFAIQLDEFTDVSGKAQLVAFVRFVYKAEIVEQFLFCRQLQETTKEQDIFNVVDNYFNLHKFTWSSCISICTDDARSMSRCLKGFVALAQKKNPTIVFTHCFLHREVLTSKSLVPELKTVLDQVVSIVNYIKSRLLQSRLFAKLCSAMESCHTQLLSRTKVRWLSRGRVLTRFYELKEEVQTFLTTQKHELAKFLNDEVWCNKVAFLADLFQSLNTLNKSMQGKTENILTSTDKMNAFKEKLILWSGRIKKRKCSRNVRAH